MHGVVLKSLWKWAAYSTLAAAKVCPIVPANDCSIIAQHPALSAIRGGFALPKPDQNRMNPTFLPYNLSRQPERKHVQLLIAPDARTGEYW